MTEMVDLDTGQVDWLGGESARVGGNLLLLLDRGWPEMVAVGGRMAVYAVTGTLLVGVATAVLGWALYLLVAGRLLKRGWNTGRLIGCIAATAIVLCAGAGGCWAGLWLGAGRALEEAIEQRYVVERMAAATFLAFTLDEGEYPQGIDTDEVDALLDRAQSRSAESWASFRDRAEAVAGDAGLEQPGWLPADLIVAAVQRLGGGGEPDLIALHGVLSTPEVSDRGDALPQTAGIRKRAVGLLRGTVFMQVATGVGLGLVLPLVALVLFGLLGSAFRRGSRPAHDTTNR